MDANGEIMQNGKIMHKTPLTNMMEMMQKKMKEKGLTAEQIRKDIGIKRYEK